MLLILVAVGFAIYKSCIAGGRSHNAPSSSSYQSGSAYSSTSGAYPPPQQGVNSGGGGFWTGTYCV